MVCLLFTLLNCVCLVKIKVSKTSISTFSLVVVTVQFIIKRLKQGKTNSNVPFILNKQKSILKNPRQFVQRLSYVTAQSVSKIRNPGQKDTTSLLSKVVV